MDKSVIFEVFGELRDAQMVGSEQEFCRIWLGRSESYLRTIRFKRTQPSLGTLAICADRLRQESQAGSGDDTERSALLNSLWKQCCLALEPSPSIQPS